MNIFFERNLELSGHWGCNEIRYLLADYKSLYSILSDCCLGSELKVTNTKEHSAKKGGFLHLFSV